MTFGEKLRVLRTEANISQEELSEKLNVSRQSVSKWENNNGYPEMEKIIRISHIFQVSLDELLKEQNNHSESMEKESGKKTGHEQAEGYYVSRELADGYLAFQKARFIRIALAAAVILGGNAVSFNSTENGNVFLYRILPSINSGMVFIGLVLLVWVWLTHNPYRVLRKKPLLFDFNVKDELNKEFKKIKVPAAAAILFSVILLYFFQISILPEFLFFGEEWVNTYTFMTETAVSYVLSCMLATGMAVFMLVFCIGILRSYMILIKE